MWELFQTKGNEDGKDSVYFRRKRALVLFAGRAGVPSDAGRKGVVFCEKRDSGMPGPAVVLPIRIIRAIRGSSWAEITSGTHVLLWSERDDDFFQAWFAAQ